MNRPICILLLCLVFSSCTNKQRQLDNERNILGDWVKVRNKINPNTNKVIFEPPEFMTKGFTFSSNHTFYNKNGYFDYISPNVSFSERTSKANIYLGAISKFFITADSLKLFDRDDIKWDNYRIFKLTHDSLLLESNGSYETYIRYHIKKTGTPPFDKIVLSSSGCFGTCPRSDIILNSDGTILFNGQFFTSKNGLFVGQVSKKIYQELQDNFRRSNFNSFENEYRRGGTDQETITTTFVKDGQIFKTITDYGRKAPYLFAWAYVPLRYLYQSIPLKKIDFPIFAQDSTNVISTRLRKGYMTLDLKQSESFLLFDYLRKGKTSNASFKERFKMKVYYTRKLDKFYNLSTDGRYYKFIVNGKPLTIDIGFNFYDINAKNWTWTDLSEFE